MTKRFTKRLLSAITAFAIMVTALITADFSSIGNPIETNAAVSKDYAPQLMNIALYDDSKNLTVSSTADKTSASLADENGTLNEQWRIDYCGANSNGNYYKIVNAASGRLLTPYAYSVLNGTETVIYGNENDKSQYWYIIPVSQDKHGNDLHYKIVNYSNSSLALTAGASGTSLSDYNGSNSQKWLLNCAGLQGFAGYCFDDNTGNIKASDIGGVLGETVEVSTFDELKKYATSDTPYTIVVTSDIKVTSLKKDSSGRYYCPDGRIYVHNNKTIIGSYSAHTLYNVQFCTSTQNGVGNNLIIKNFELQHDSESNGNDSIVVYFGSGKNLWVDHCTFTGHSDYNTASTGLEDWDKFLACCYDADYCTVSDSSFGLHEYGLILGYPADDDNSYKNYNNFPRMSLISNRFQKTLTRGPGLMRYGYFHSLNNYVNTFSMAYTVHTASKIFAESCCYENGGNVICDWNTVIYPGSYAESGSQFSKCNRTTIEGNAQNCSWRPNKNYSYTALSASDAKSHCTTYSGAQSSNNTEKYSSYQNAGVPSATFMKAPEDSWGVTAAEIAIDTYFMIKNANSGLYLDIDGGKGANGTNIQQWGASEAGIQNTWRFVPAGDGYYYIQSMVGDKTYVMDVSGGKSSNGTNIALYSYKGNDNQKFMIAANSDGTFKIIPKVGGGNIFVEIESASTTSGANCQLWEKTGSSCQDWTFEEVGFSGEKMDTTVHYMFKNAASGLYMEVAGGKDEDSANVQQWGANGSGENNSGDWNSWTLKSATGDLYYIVSDLAGSRYVNINNGNAEISARNSSSNTQMMRFVKNPDGSYCIVTRTSYDKSTGRYTKGIEVADASSSAGANVRQWELNGASCQNWIAETYTTTTTTTTSTTTTVTTTTTTEPTPVNLSGDLSLDGKINIADIVLLQKYLLGTEKFTRKQFEIGDMNKDGAVDAFDMVLLRKEIIKIVYSK